MVRTLKDLQNQKSYDLETWRVALGTQVYINDDPGLTLTYFTTRLNLAASALECETLLQSYLMGKTCIKYSRQ